MSSENVICNVDGGTRLFAILGDPIAQVKAPQLMNPVFAGSGMNAVMVPVHASPDELGTVVTGLMRIQNLDGMLVTVPHKFSVCAFAQHVSDAARLSGAANALRREADGSWSAENFDGKGFVAGLEKSGYTVKDKVIALAGAGGAGASIAVALAIAGARRVHVVDPASDKSMALAQRVEPAYPGVVRAETSGSQDFWLQADIAVNASPLGLRPEDPVPLDVSRLREGALVAECIMRPAQTKLLLAAEQRGLAVHQGIHMLEAQLEAYRRFFRVPSQA